MSEIKDSGNRTEFGTGAVRDLSEGKGRMDLLPWHGIIEISKHCETGAKKYGEHNVDKGLPEWSLISSGARHLAEYIAGMADEDHLRAACWNLLWALNQRTTHPELMDVARREWEKPEPEPLKPFETEPEHVETCRERLKREHPNLVDDKFVGECKGCPSSYGYAKAPDYCSQRRVTEADCAECWGRPVEVTE